MHFMTMLATVSHKFIIHPVTKTTSMMEEMLQLRNKMVKRVASALGHVYHQV